MGVFWLESSVGLLKSPYLEIIWASEGVWGPFEKVQIPFGERSLSNFRVGASEIMYGLMVNEMASQGE